jgi:hypothetical protein
MDQNVLVTGGQAMVKALDSAGIPPRVAMWVHDTDSDTWKLWIVPPVGMKDKHEFYRRVAALISAHRTDFGGIDTSDTEMILDSHPAMEGLRNFIKAPGLNSIYFPGNRFDKFYLSDGIILRADL